MSGHDLLAMTRRNIKNIIWFRVFNDCGTQHGDFVLNGEVTEVCRAVGNLSADSKRHMQELGKVLKVWDVRAALVRVVETLTSTRLTTVRVAELVYVLSEMSRLYIKEQRRSDVSSLIQTFPVIVKMG